jgi:hypothetical protein
VIDNALPWLPIIMSAGMENKVDNPKNARLVLVSDDEDDENVQEAPIATEDLLAQYPDDSEASVTHDLYFLIH